jgi:SAM domain (Sterile alpha motif)
LDIGVWLAGLGMERYAQAFQANDVGPEALAELTDGDLRELGVSLGHRRCCSRRSANLRLRRRPRGCQNILSSNSPPSMPRRLPQTLLGPAPSGAV